MLALTLTAELEGVTDLRPTDTEDSPFYYMFKVQCTSCRKTHDNWVGVSRFESREIHGSRGEANFVWRCKNCQRESSAGRFCGASTPDFTRFTSYHAVIKTEPAAYGQKSPPKPQNILTFECRGCEFVQFKPEGEWEAKGAESNTPFASIDLSEGEWFDYDEKAGGEVSIKDMEWVIRRA